MPTTERPTMLERFNEFSVIRWMTGRAASNGHTNGHALNGKPQATSLLARAIESREIAEIVEKMRTDYQVAFCERILGANVSAVRVTIAAEGDDPCAVQCAERLQELWDSSVAKMSDDVGYGRVAHEKVWECDDVAGIHYVRKLEPLPFRESRMVLEDDGSFGGIEMKTKGNTWELIPAFDAWWQALGATAKQPHGQSRFVPAPYEVWKNKSGTVRNRASATSKFALRGPIIRGPIQDTDELTGLQFDVLNELAPAVDIWARGGMLYLSNDVHPGMEGEFKYAVVQAELQGFDPNALNVTIERHDVEMCRAFGIPEQTIIEAGAVGTYGSIAQKMLILFATVEEILSQRVESFQKYVIKPTCEVNGLPESATIKATFVPLTKRPDAFVFQVITLLLANPAFIEGILSGGIDVREILVQAGLPVTDELEAVLKAVAQRMAAAGGMVPGQQGGGFGAEDDLPVGEYASISRQQWKRNRSAINDVLEDLAAGKISRVIASEQLQMLGLRPERAEAWIEDKLDDGTVDDPEFSLADDLWDDELFGSKKKIALAWSSDLHPRNKSGMFVSKGTLATAAGNAKSAELIREQISPDDLPGYDTEMRKVHGASYAPKESKPQAKPVAKPKPSAKPKPDAIQPKIVAERPDTSKMTKIGEGASRRVFDDGDTVVKEAKNRQAKNDNKIEMAISTKHPLFAKVVEGAKDGSWIRQEKLAPAADADMAHAYGVSPKDAEKVYVVPITDAFGLPNKIKGNWMVASAWAAYGSPRAEGLGKSADRFINDLKSVRAAAPGVDVTDLGYAAQWGRGADDRPKIVDFSFAKALADDIWQDDDFWEVRG